MSEQSPLVSLVIVSYHSAALLAALFDSLATTRTVAYEVIVVDNASSDGSAELARRLCPTAKLIANPSNLGFGTACNLGAKCARGDYLVFMNPDVIVTPDWLAILTRHMAENPDAAIICPQTREPPIDGQTFTAEPVTQAVRETAAVPGCAMMVRRAAWEQLGGFDPRIFLYWEDTELCWRAWLNGWRVLEDCEAVVFHERGGSGGGVRWDGLRIQHGIYSYLKLMRWRVTLPFLFSQAARSLVKGLRGQSAAMRHAWGWNLRGLGLTLAARRAAARQRIGDQRRLEQLVREHTRRQRRERSQRHHQRKQQANNP